MEAIIAIVSALAIYWVYTLLTRQEWPRRGPGLSVSFLRPR